VHGSGQLFQVTVLIPAKMTFRQVILGISFFYFLQYLFPIYVYCIPKLIAELMLKFLTVIIYIKNKTGCDRNDFMEEKFNRCVVKSFTDFIR
jgi:hypothetical protein